MTEENDFVYIKPPEFPEPPIAFSYGVKTKPNVSLVFVSGLGPLDDQGTSLVGFDIYTQTCRVMDRIKQVLEEAGASLDNIISMRVKITNNHDLGKCCEAYTNYFKQVPSIVIEAVPGFTHGPGQLVEIESIAAV